MTVDRRDRDEPRRWTIYVCSNCGTDERDYRMDLSLRCKPGFNHVFDPCDVIEVRPSPGPAGSTTGDYAGLLSEENVEAGARAVATGRYGVQYEVTQHDRDLSRRVLEAVANRVSEPSTGGE